MVKSKDFFLDEQMAAASGHVNKTPSAPQKQTFVGKQLSAHYAASDKLYAIQAATITLNAAKRKLEEVKADVAPAMQPFDQAVNRATMEVLDARAKLYKLNSDYVDTLFSLVEAAVMDDCSPSKTEA